MSMVVTELVIDCAADKGAAQSSVDGAFARPAKTAAKRLADPVMPTEMAKPEIES